ncbi:hypothetical protein ACFSTE_08925 [Aquimarina hainanensis]|uniref:Roadblock/LAMTOR2 domain-containing protein n=1 Tax=Aquimarina hainanensis TaxID=1578017 RepID=A0ABW5N701_9FLAO|nr:hypothetical protein [Aquimarina sp. TRL1]QKX03888.1 hypothetical protein HN014_02860 [Aquimarina sp. TRL1]
MPDLKEIQDLTNAEIVLMANEKGDIIDSINVEYDSNIALMTETAFTMCDELSQDLINGHLDQLVAKTSEGYFIANKIDSEFIILIASRDLSKLGLLLKYMSNIK